MKARLLHRHEDAVTDLAFDRFRQVSLAGRVLDQDHLAGANDARLAVARGDLDAGVEVDDYAGAAPDAKICAQESCTGTVKNIQNFGIKNQEELFEIAKLCANKDGGVMSAYIQNFGLTNQGKLFEIAKLCAKQYGTGTARNIKKFEIEDPEKIFEIAKLCAQEWGKGVAQSIQNFGIKDPEKLYQIAKLCAEQNGGGTTEFIQNFGITDPEKLFEIAKLCAKKNGAATAKNIKNFGITNPDKLFKIAKLCAEQNGGGTAEFIQNFGITDPEKLFEIVQSCAQQHGMGTAKNIKNFGITDPEKLFEIAKLCAKQNAGMVEYLFNFEIKDPEKLFEIAKTCAMQDGKTTTMYNRYFGITDQERLFEIIKLCAKQNGEGTANVITGFKDKEMLFEIAKVCAGQNGLGTLTHIRNFGLDSVQEKAVLLRALMQSQDILFHLSKFDLDPESTRRPYWKYRFLENQEPWPNENAIAILKEYEKSSFQGRFLPLIDSIGMVTNSQARKQLSLWLGSALLLVRECLAEEQIRWLDKEALLPAVMALQIPYLRHPLTSALLTLAQSPHACQVYKKLPKSKYEKARWGCLLRAVVSSLAEEDFVLAEKIVATCDKSFTTFKDIKKLGVLIKILMHIKKEETLTDKDRKRILKQMFLSKGKELLKQCYALSSIFDLGQGPILKSWHGTFPSCAEKALREKIPFGAIDNLSQKYMESFGTSRQPQALVLYTSKMASLNDKKVMECLGDFARAVLEGTFSVERYALLKNPHLTVLFGEGKNSQICEEWKKGSIEDVSSYASKEVKEKRIPADLAWLKQKLVTDRHLDLSFFSDLRNYLDHPETINEVRKELIQKEGEKSSPKLRFQRLCLDLVESASNLDKLKILDELAGILTEKEFAHPEFLNDVKGLIDQSKKGTKLQAKVVDTDDPIDLLLCGTEVSGSCQRLDGDPSNNKGLLGYLMDGKNRLLAIKDQDGRILARCILRLLLDGEKPVLFRERLYPDGLSDDYTRALNGLALKKAQNLKVPLTSLDGTGQVYPHSLQALGGPAPFEYSDGSGGVQPQGKYNLITVRLFV